MSTWILFVAIYSNNPFYGADYVPTMKFDTKDQCERTLSVVQSKNEKTKAFCWNIDDKK